MVSNVRAAATAESRSHLALAAFFPQSDKFKKRNSDVASKRRQARFNLRDRGGALARKRHDLVGVISKKH
jgi:hypothetical protein